MEKINKENKNKVVNYICAALLRLVVAASQLGSLFRSLFRSLLPPPSYTEGCPIEFFFVGTIEDYI